MRKSLIRSVASKSISTLSPGEKLKAHNRKEANEMFLFHISQLQAKPDKEYYHIGHVEDGLVQHDPDLLSAHIGGPGPSSGSSIPLIRYTPTRNGQDEMRIAWRLVQIPPTKLTWTSLYSRIYRVAALP